MSWFKKTTASVKMTTVIALESLSQDMLEAQLHLLEAELSTAGFSVRRLEFPSSSAESNVPGLLDTPSLVESAQSLGIIAAVDRARTFARLGETPEKEVIVCTGSSLATMAWLTANVEEHGERIGLYRWLDELEHMVLSQKRVDFTVFLDCLPDHIDIHETVLVPVGWGSREVPEVTTLRERYIEAAKLTPGAKIISCFREDLLKPDSEIQNELWNLVRRVALKSNLRPKV